MKYPGLLHIYLIDRQMSAATLALLRTRLNVSARELDSVLRLIRSQVHLSLVRHLGGPSDRVEDDVLELDESELEEA